MKGYEERDVVGKERERNMMLALLILIHRERKTMRNYEKQNRLRHAHYLL